MSTSCPTTLSFGKRLAPSLFRVGSAWVLGVLLGVLVGVPLVGLSQEAAYPQPSGFVNDFAGVLSPEERAALEQKLAGFRSQTQNEIAIALFEQLPDGAGSVESYTVELAQQWGIGTAEQQNGVLVAVFLADKKARIEVGYGLEGDIPDARANRIYTEQMRPLFQQGAYYQGLDAGVSALMMAAVGEDAPPATAEPQPLKRRRPARTDGKPNIPAALFMIALFLFVMWRMSRGGGGRGGRGGGGGIFLYGGGFGYGPGYGGGFGSGGGGDSGFGGFGGGDFGGGGASGDW